MTRLDDGTPIHSGARPAFDYMVGLIKELQAVRNEAKAREALRAFIFVRRQYQPRYESFADEQTQTPEQWLAAIKTLVKTDSEGGKRAQAIVAGLLDIFVGSARVESGRINDPSRHYPGDVCLRSASDPTSWEKAFEVRDKPVSESDIYIFGRKCIEHDVSDAAIVMVSERQQKLDAGALAAFAVQSGIGITLFYGWADFVGQVLFWSALSASLAASRAVASIAQRLKDVEVSPAALTQWASLTGPSKQ